MRNGFRITPAELISAAPAFTAAAEELAEAQRALAETMGRLGECWGEDEQGAQFAASYRPQRERLDAVVSTLTEGLASIDPALRAWGANVEAADRTAMPGPVT